MPYPRDWDPDAELRGWFGIYAHGPRGHITIDFTPAAAPYVHARIWGDGQHLSPLPDGGVRLAMDSGGLELTRWVLEWGDAARVVSPDWLRQAVCQQLAAALAQYPED